MSFSDNWNHQSPLYHGGAPGFRVGDMITPHPTKHVDGCAVCAAEADENHLPDRVFATPVRLYAKHYASKWGLGWLYRVSPVGELVRSEPDSFESYHAPAFRVEAILERAVQLTPSERRRLYRMWTEADRARGLPDPPPMEEWLLKKQLGFRMGLA